MMQRDNPGPLEWPFPYADEVITIAYDGDDYEARMAILSDMARCHADWLQRRAAAMDEPYPED